MQLLGIDLSLEEFDALMVAQNNGKELAVKDGKVVALNHVTTQKEQLNNELEDLLNWFNWYDLQVKKYLRSERLDVRFDDNIEELDNIAVKNAERIDEIRKLLED